MHPFHRRRVASVAVLALVIATAFAGPKIGQEAPDFSGVTLQGDKITLKQFRGKRAVLLNFYASG